MAHAFKLCGHCKSEVEAELRRFRCSNDTYQIKFQCLSCGAAIGNPLPHWQVQSLGDVPPWDTRISDQQNKEYENRQVAYRAELAIRDARYRNYLSSPEWRAKRKLVLERANNICEGCLTANAKEVHHTTYAHIYKEFLFELVALCDGCHKRYHTVPPDVAMNR